MDNNIILEKARQIARLNSTAPMKEYAGSLEQAQNMLLEHLKNNPQDTDAWLLLICIECSPPFDYPDTIIEYCNHILSYDPSNPYALLFLSYADYYVMGNSNKELYDKLCMVQSDNKEIKAMVEIAKARYLEFRDIKKFEEALKKSIEYCHNFRTNLCMLGLFYLEQGDIKGLRLFKQGLENIRQVATPSSTHVYDPTSIKDFLDEFFAGRIIGIVEYEQLHYIIQDL